VERGVTAAHSSTPSFSWPVRVYYEDTDSGGVVYYANYLKFLERARTEWLRAAGFEQTQLFSDFNVIFVVRSVAIEYLRPAVFNDLLKVTATPAKIGRSSIEIAQTVERDEILVTAHVKIISVDGTSFKPVRIPTPVREKLERPS
jgi:acyl-CoA thioester hydrolase